MYLSHLSVENFRIFGSKEAGSHLDLDLTPGMNVFVGENDSGKSAIIDAIRIALRTSSNDFYRLTDDDFHVELVDGEPIRASQFSIQCTFSEIQQDEIGRFLEWLSVDDDGKPTLVVTYIAERRDDQGSSRGYRFPYRIYSGKNADGPRIEGDIREFLRTTYLKPLRDAEAELAPGKGSRLSQILASHPNFQTQAENDFEPDSVEKPESLIGIMRQAEYLIGQNEVVRYARDQLNQQYLGELSLNEDSLTAGIGVSRQSSLREILEKLELWLQPDTQTGSRTRRGLGFNNALFMAAELLLLGESGVDSLPLLLIEEPEAHLHPQMQLRLMSFLETKCRTAAEDKPSTAAEDKPSTAAEGKPSTAAEGKPSTAAQKGTAQIFLTTHSPNLASKAKLRNMTLMHRGKAFPLDSDHTRLSLSDYRFLERFLDVTKANLFFAKGVLMVEGDAENILVPVLASLLGRSFSKHGISVVNVGHTGFFRFARILQSTDDCREIPIRVACLADRDIVPDEAKGYVNQRKNRQGEDIPTFKSQFNDEEVEKKVNTKKKADYANTKTFVSPCWTLEYDLAVSGLAEEALAAVMIAKKEKNRDENYGDVVSDKEWEQCRKDARKRVQAWHGTKQSADQMAAEIYRDLFKTNASKAVFAQTLAEILQKEPPSNLRGQLPKYLLDAIEHLTGPWPLA